MEKLNLIEQIPNKVQDEIFQSLQCEETKTEFTFSSTKNNLCIVNIPKGCEFEIVEHAGFPGLSLRYNNVQVEMDRNGFSVYIKKSIHATSHV